MVNLILNELNYILNVIDDKTKNIDYVQKLEGEFCKKFKVRYSIACTCMKNVRLHTSFIAIGVGPGDEVIVPGLTVVMDAYAAIHLEQNQYLLKLTEIPFYLKQLKKSQKKTKAIILVSLQGLPVDIDPIRKLAKKNNIYIIMIMHKIFLENIKNKYLVH